jgi:chemotaxis signal transduction protein
MSLDSTAIHAVLARLEAQTKGEITPERAEKILKDRARQLAARQDVTTQRRVLFEVVAVKRGDSLIGFPMAEAQEIRHIKAVPLPHATLYVQGLFQLRGEVSCLIDLQPFFGALPDNGEVMAVLVTHGGETCGYRIDALVGPRQVFADECNKQNELWAHDFALGFTHDLLTIVNVEKLRQRPELVLDVAR